MVVDEEVRHRRAPLVHAQVRRLDLVPRCDALRVQVQDLADRRKVRLQHATGTRETNPSGSVHMTLHSGHLRALADVPCPKLDICNRLKSRAKESSAVLQHVLRVERRADAGLRLRVCARASACALASTCVTCASACRLDHAQLSGAAPCRPARSGCGCASASAARTPPTQSPSPAPRSAHRSCTTVDDGQHCL